MKVLQISTPFLPVSPDLKYGGTERVVYLLDSNLNKKNLSAGVVSTQSAKPASKLYSTIIENVGVASVLDRTQKEAWQGMFLRFEHIALAIKYANTIKDVDIVHLHDDNILIFDHLIKKPTLLTLHSDVSGFWDPKLTPSVKKTKTKLVSISRSQKKIYEEHGNSISYVVYNGVDEDLFAPSKEKYNYLFSLGGVMPVKGQEHAIEVAIKTGIDLIISGNIGDETYYNKKIKPKITHDITKENDKLASYLNLPKTKEPKIVFTGPVNDKQKNPLYSHAKLFLMPIDWEEPFGLVMVESMLSGTPVIAYNRGSVPEVVDKETGIIVEDLQGMIGAIGGIEKIDSQKCRDTAIKKFGKKAMVENYIKVYQDILSNQ